MNPMKFVPPAQSWFLLLVSVEAGPFLDLPLSNEGAEQERAKEKTGLALAANILYVKTKREA